METTDEMEARWEAEMKAAGVPNETEMRDASPPDPRTYEELVEAIKTLVERPHSYGTCVYALSHGAVAAFNFIASKLRMTGFQAGCADFDILRHTRNWKWGKLLNYENLLYPQCCDEEHFPSVATLLEMNKEELAKRAREKIQENPDAHPSVIEHWGKLAGMG